MQASIRRLRPDDHFLILAESDNTPMHIGALIILETSESTKNNVYQALLRHLEVKISKSPLACELAYAPDRYDSDAWFRLDSVDFSRLITHCDSHIDDHKLNEIVAQEAMKRLDLSDAPFRGRIFTGLDAGRSAILLFVHHAFADGVGFQTLLGYLADDGKASVFSPCDWPGERIRNSDWLALAQQDFQRTEVDAADRSAARKAALSALKTFDETPGCGPAQTPVLPLSERTSRLRSYRRISFPFAPFRALSKQLGATINDTFLAVSSGAVRRYLMEIGELPERPIVVNMARSYRQKDHGVLGNRIVAMHPELATDESDVLTRLKRIQESTAKEKRRSEISQRLLDQPEIPFGPSKREERLKARVQSGASVLPGNISLSNVPGPAEDRYFAGWRQLSNHPVPALGNGRFLNITSRRNANALDWGITVDAAQIPNIDQLVAFLFESHREMAALVGASSES